jgi:hypothetical protein
LSAVTIYNSKFSNIFETAYGGAIYFNVTNDNKFNNLKLEVKGKNEFFGCKARFGGAIYHRSSSLESNFEALFWNNSDENRIFNDVSGFPDNIYITFN